MRNNDLKKERDQRIVEKFHEMYDVKRRRMDDVLKELSEKHFFLDTNYIYRIIFYNHKNNKYYNELIENEN